MHSPAVPVGKRPRLLDAQLQHEHFQAGEDLVQQRLLSQSRLKSTWESIFARYSKDFEGIADEIDSKTGEIVVDNGHLRGMLDEEEQGEDMFGWGEIVRKRKRTDSDADLKLSGISTIFETERSQELCEFCWEMDELDPSICAHCSRNDDGRNTLVEGLVADGSPRPDRICTTPANSHFSKGQDLTEDVALLETVENSPKLPKIPVESEPKSGSELSTGNIPSDAFIMQQLGSHGTVVIELLARARVATSSPTKPPNSPLKTPQGTRIVRKQPIESTKKKGTQRADDVSQRDHLSAPSIPPSSPPQLPRPPPPPPSSPPFPTIKLPKSPPKNPRPRKALRADSLPPDSDDLPDPSTLLRVTSTPSRQPMKPLPTNTAQSVEKYSEDFWAAPPPQSDPFYEPLWSDPHPDGTPLKFLPRVIDPIFRTPATPASAIKKKSTPATTTTATPATAIKKTSPIHTHSITTDKGNKNKNTSNRPIATPNTRKKRTSAHTASTLGKSTTTPSKTTPSARSSTKKSLVVKKEKETLGWTSTPTASALQGRRRNSEDVSILEFIKSRVKEEEEDDYKPRSTTKHPPQTPHGKGRAVFIKTEQLDDNKHKFFEIPDSDEEREKQKQKQKQRRKSGGGGGGDNSTGELKKERKCGQVGYKCEKRFCFTCIGMEGEEDDLV